MPSGNKLLLSILAVLACIGILFANKTLSSTPKAAYQPQVKEVRQLLDNAAGQGDVLQTAKMKLDEILREHPEAAEAHREYARYHIMSGYRGGESVAPESLAAAEKSLTTALDLQPDFADAHVLAGHLYLIMHDLPKSRAALERAEAIGTQDPWLNLNWAALLNKEGKTAEAVDRFKRTIASKTPNSKAMRSAHQGLIEHLLASGTFAEVDAAYQQLIQYDPNHAWTRGNYASFLLCNTDNADKAIPEYRKALEIMDYGMARGGLAAALYRKWAERSMTTGTPPTAPSAEFTEAQSLVEGTPIEVALAYCCEGPVVNAISNFDPITSSEMPSCRSP